MSTDGTVDPWSKFLNAFVIDRDGYRIERRNVQDVFVTLYSHQVPAGAADITHYSFRTPTAGGALTVRAALKYRKFDVTYWQAVFGDARPNDLPVVTVAADERVIHVGTTPSHATASAAVTAAAERWYDYGIALFRQGEQGTIKGDLRQADAAFAQAQDHSTGESAALSGAAALGRARTAIKEGRLDDARTHLIAAANAPVPAWPWAIRYWSGVLNRENGALDEAVADFEAVLGNAFPEVSARGFDFSRDERVAVTLGETLLERARRDRSRMRRADQASQEEPADAARAASLAERALNADPESVAAWYLLAQASSELGDVAAAERAMREHDRYRLNDNARDRAIRLARERYPAAARAADPITLYTLGPAGNRK
jgi:hypothetical protein